MDRRRSAAAARVFDDFEPEVEWKLAGEEQDVVEISLPGFRKDQVRVQVDNHGVLRATGERPVRGGRWARFKKDLQLPDNCDADGVRARFEAEKLIITLPIVAPAPPSPSPPSPPQPPSHSPTPSPPPPPPPPPQPPILPPQPPSPSPPPSLPTEPARRPEPTPIAPRPSPPPPGPPTAAKPGTEERKPSNSWHETPGAAAPEPKLQDASTMPPMMRQEDGKDSRSPPPAPPPETKRHKTKRAGGVMDETAGSAKRPEKNNQAVGDAPTPATMTPEPGRQLLLNAAAAVAVLVGVIVAVWRTMQS